MAFIYSSKIADLGDWEMEKEKEEERRRRRRRSGVIVDVSNVLVK